MNIQLIEVYDLGFDNFDRVSSPFDRVSSGKKTQIKKPSRLYTLEIKDLFKKQTFGHIVIKKKNTKKNLLD